MGAMQNNPDGKKGKRGRRGSVNNGNRLESFARSGSSSGADWGGCSAEVLQQVVVLITEMGGAVILGLSRDLGAHSLTLMLDGNRETLWFNGGADLTEELVDVVGKLKAMSD